MTERKFENNQLRQIGKKIRGYRKDLGGKCLTLEGFVEDRSIILFDCKEWISVRHLSNIERGKSAMSNELLIMLAKALEKDPHEIFEDIVNVYNE